MQLPSIPLFDVLRERMSWLNTRQNVLSTNVANADTPGYDARDIKPMDFAALLKRAAGTGATPGALTVTDPHHIALKGSAGTFQDYSAPDTESTSGGNTVSLEQEMIKVADTQAQYQIATNLYSKAINMMRTAIGKPGG
jgi:flagellar basal-body rod protein FlgB